MAMIIIVAVSDRPTCNSVGVIGNDSVCGDSIGGGIGSGSIDGGSIPGNCIGVDNKADSSNKCKQ